LKFYNTDSAIVGGIVGGVIVISVVMGLVHVYCCASKRKSRKEHSINQHHKNQSKCDLLKAERKQGATNFRTPIESTKASRWTKALVGSGDLEE
jgi:hypothetical protein